MSRLPSQDSIGAHSQRTAHSSGTNTFDPSWSTRMYPSLSQDSFHMSSTRSDVTGRSITPEDPTLSTPIQQLEIQEYDYPFLGDDLGSIHPMFHRNSMTDTDSHSINASLPGPSFNSYATAEDDSFVSSFAVGSTSLASQTLVSGGSVMYHTGAGIDSSILWDNATDFLDSQTSSPIAPEDSWPIALPMTTSSTTSPANYSPSIEAISPRYVQDISDLMELAPYATGDRVKRRPMGPRPSKVASDLAANSRQQRRLGTSDTSEESLKLVGGRSSLEIDNTARDHPLYHNVSPLADGLYHCPWEGQPSCQHKPEKLKCNYE